MVVENRTKKTEEYKITLKLSVHGTGTKISNENHSQPKLLGIYKSAWAIQWANIKKDTSPYEQVNETT